MVNNKDIEARLNQLERQIKHKKHKQEYDKYTEYLNENGEHAGWQILCRGIEEDYIIIIGDEEKELNEIKYDATNDIATLVPKGKKELQTIIDNIKDERGYKEEPYSGLLKEHDAIITNVPKPIIDKPKPETKPHIESERERAERIRQTAIAIQRDFPDAYDIDFRV
jgi:hypothetical protein